MAASNTYSVPEEARKLFETGILNNPLMNGIPLETESLSKHVTFEGSSKPIIPINWRFAESISSLKAFEATMLNLLITRKYRVPALDIVINTDHASLFFMSPLVIQDITSNGERIPAGPETWARLFPGSDKHRVLATNIYETKDGKFYHTHGSLNPDKTLAALELAANGQPGDDIEKVVPRIQAAVLRHDAASLDHLMNETHRQAGTVAWTAEEYLATEHGRAAGQVGLYDIIKDPAASQPASWWPDNQSHPSSPKRPLAGLKVVDLTRIIAGPTITRGLAEMGASIMRVTGPHIPDLEVLHQDLNWGKWNCHLDLRQEEDKEKLRRLIAEADVVVDGYRPGVMERHGFGRQAIFDLVKDRSRGIIHLRENCYGWRGPWSHRSGWQQISDSCCGISRGYAKAMGVKGAVTPVFPNSDYCTGVSGSVAILDALIKRGEKGDSYGVDVALNYYSQWLVRSCGAYDEQVWKEVWERHNRPVYQHYHGMFHTVPAMMSILRDSCSDVLFRDSYFERRTSHVKNLTTFEVKPIAQFEDQAVELGFTVGTRGNGVDQPFWPEDLTTEVVA